VKKLVGQVMEGFLIPTNPIEYAGDYTVPKGHDIRVSAAGGDVVATGTMRLQYDHEYDHGITEVAPLSEMKDEHSARTTIL